MLGLRFVLDVRLGRGIRRRCRTRAPQDAALREPRLEQSGGCEPVAAAAGPLGVGPLEPESLIERVGREGRAVAERSP